MLNKNCTAVYAQVLINKCSFSQIKDLLLQIPAEIRLEHNSNTVVAFWGWWSKMMKVALRGARQLVGQVWIIRLGCKGTACLSICPPPHKHHLCQLTETIDSSFGASGPQSSWSFRMLLQVWTITAQIHFTWGKIMGVYTTKWITKQPIYSTQLSLTSSSR